MTNERCPSSINKSSKVVNCNITVHSVEEYLRAVDEVFKTLCPEQNRCELWYRGQPVSRFNLIPRIARGDLNPELEVIFLSKFKSLAIPYVQSIPSFPIPNGRAAYWHWLIMMQHYGVPTRLLDWSRDALTGLYFAVNQTGDEIGNNAAVWVLNPVILNTAFNFHSFTAPGYIPNLDEPIVDVYFGPNARVLETKKPAAVIGPLNNPNIVAQRGTFTVFPEVKEVTPLNLFPDSSDYLVKICIPFNSIAAIKIQLRHYGVTKLSLFPELDSIANEITTQAIQEGQLPEPNTSA